ncbi:membrane progestin receptor gamma-like [Gigantopelta aegis]|uniref:membrane progestin receptor gamma-like n=1 Tax=Gigantopelta aegis TaxID=1735272 RepID=UPI001B88D59B|nr:membrane progestin receptor gamma-like [Gigantopelta aegis]
MPSDMDKDPKSRLFESEQMTDISPGKINNGLKSRVSESEQMTDTAPSSEMNNNGLSGPLYKVDQVPEHFHELFILRGYRHPKSSALQCVLSVFDATNETLNFWTHFLPSCYFLWMLKGLAETLDFKHDSYTWPLLGYVFSCCIFPLASAVAHTFNTMSHKARHICFFLDYAALSVFTLGVATAYRAYSFPSQLCETWYGRYFICGAVVNSILCTATACETRFMKPSLLRKILRLGAFALPYVYDSVPLMFRLLFCESDDCGLASTYFHTRQFVFAFLAAFLYTTHLPERFYPGQFDIIGHSHQLFHVSSILATFDQLQAILLDMQQRRVNRLPVWTTTALHDSINVMMYIMFINTVIIGLFSLRLLRKTKMM